MTRLSMFVSMFFLVLAVGCGGDDGDGAGPSDGPDAGGGGGGGSESAVVTCYGSGCPHSACDESEVAGDCDPYDDAGYNVTNVESVCASSQTGSYCVVTSNRDDGQYEFGNGTYFFVSCEDGAGDVDLCVNNGCEATFGCS